jgi:hypothetical protein
LRIAHVGARRAVAEGDSADQGHPNDGLTLSAALGRGRHELANAYRRRPRQAPTFKRSHDPQFIAKFARVVCLHFDPPAHAVAPPLDKKGPIPHSIVASRAALQASLLRQSAVFLY